MATAGIRITKAAGKRALGPATAALVLAVWLLGFTWSQAATAASGKLTTTVASHASGKLTTTVASHGATAPQQHKSKSKNRPGNTRFGATKHPLDNSRAGASKHPLDNTRAGASKQRRHDARAAASKKPPPQANISSVACEPYGKCSGNPHEVFIHGGLLKLAGKGLRPWMNVAFPSRYKGHLVGPTWKTAPKAVLRRNKLGLLVKVPKHAASGRITVLLGHGRHSNLYGRVRLVGHALHPPYKRSATAIDPSPTGTAFDGAGMWIWYVSKSDGGSLPAIFADAKAAGVSTLYVKSSDGSSNYWSQFSPEFVATAHAEGLKVCAWQYVYGTHPVAEAELGAKAVEAGADCLVIDAEAEYEGHYAAAQRYIETLRAKVGSEYPVGLASFPYVDYHGSFPYSVFFGPDGAQFNLPQMYWKDIGVSVAALFEHTYEQNLIYGRVIEPLGQTFENPNPPEIVAFRSLAAAYGASGVSFWDWQETTARGWSAMSEPLNPELGPPTPEATAPLLKQGAKGDEVLWLQEHLASAIAEAPVTGIFDATTSADLKQFQEAHGLPATGETDATTWGELLELAPVAVDWTGGGPGS